MKHGRLELMLDVLLPGGEGFPTAGAIDLANWLRGQAAWAAAVEAVVASLPDAFAYVVLAEREGMLRDVEMRDPDLFGQMLVGAYSGYYTHRDVRNVIDNNTAYPMRPPQPEGYALRPFDPSVLDKVRQGSASYRKA